MFSNELRSALLCNETDITGALDRMNGDEDLYRKVLVAFLEDPTMGNLKKSLDNEDWDSAFSDAHALKGLAGNLGLIPLFHSVGELVILIRTGRTTEIEEAYHKTKNYYDAITIAIKDNS